MNEFSLLHKTLFVVLFGVMAISKKLLVCNEELLVLLSFGFFLMYTVRTFSEGIEQTFLSRSAAIQTELEECIHTEKRTSADLCAYYEGRHNMKNAFETLGVQVSHELATYTFKAPNELQHRSIEETKDRLAVLETQHKGFEAHLQKRIVETFRTSAEKL